jgi:hypothetical protein
MKTACFGNRTRNHNWNEFSARERIKRESWRRPAPLTASLSLHLSNLASHDSIPFGSALNARSAFFTTFSMMSEQSSCTKSGLLNEADAAVHYRNKSVNSNFAPSNSPRSLSLSAGMTNSAMNESVINGARSGEPQAFTSLSSLP